MADNATASTAAAEGLGVREGGGVAVGRPRAPRNTARISVRPVGLLGVDYAAINEIIRDYLAEKKRRRAHKVAAAMLRLQRLRLHEQPPVAAVDRDEEAGETTERLEDSPEDYCGAPTSL